MKSLSQLSVFLQLKAFVRFVIVLESIKLNEIIMYTGTLALITVLNSTALRFILTLKEKTNNQKYQALSIIPSILAGSEI